MKKFIIFLSILMLFSASNVLAETNPTTRTNSQSCGCCNQTKCLDLMTSMYNERATLYNVLNLSNDQQKCKDVIDKKRYEELGKQLKATKESLLAECAVGDKIWGIGLSMHDPDRMDVAKWKGKNLLGFSLMKVREVL